MSYFENGIYGLFMASQFKVIYRDHYLHLFCQFFQYFDIVN